MKLRWIGLFFVVLLGSQVFAESPKYSDEYIINLIEKTSSLHKLDHIKYHEFIGIRCPNDEISIDEKKEMIEEGYGLNLYSLRIRNMLY